MSVPHLGTLGIGAARLYLPSTVGLLTWGDEFAARSLYPPTLGPCGQEDTVRRTARRPQSCPRPLLRRIEYQANRQMMLQVGRARALSALYLQFIKFHFNL